MVKHALGNNYDKFVYCVTLAEKMDSDEMWKGIDYVQVAADKAKVYRVTFCFTDGQTFSYPANATLDPNVLHPVSRIQCCLVESKTSL